jgi:Membrane bound beta barrel domain (DUF5777)
VIREISTAALIVLSCGAVAAAQTAAPTGGGADTAMPGTATSGTGTASAAPATPAATSGPEAEKAKGEAKAKSDGTTPGTNEAGATGQEERDDAVLDRAQPDFTLINLPTTLRMPQWKSAFRVTHRFTRPLGQGTFGNLVEDAFGLDSGALIGLDFRMGILPGTHVGFYRTNDRTIELSAQYDITQQSERFPVSIAAYGAIDGTNNFRDSYSPTVGVLVSHKIADRVAVYAEPLWVNNTNPLPEEVVDENNTLLLGLGARVRIRPSVYVVGEYVPRVAGFDPGVHAASLAIEKRSGGHAFQLVFSNSFGLTMSQLARGGNRNDDWYMGFNISRKFF